MHGIHSLPDYVDLDFGQSDPTVFLQLGSKRSSTMSLRYQRAAGAEPRWNQAFTFENVFFDHGVSQHGLQMIVCEVDALGGLDYILGQATLPLNTLVRARRLVGDVPLSGVHARIFQNPGEMVICVCAYNTC